MADLIRMKAKTTFQNDRIRGGVNGVVSDGDVFETDPNHAIDLARLGHAEPVAGALTDIDPVPLEPHHSVSEPALQADRKRRAANRAADADTATVEGASSEPKQHRGND